MEKMSKNLESKGKVVNLNEARSVKSDQDRRKLERFFLKDFIQIFCVTNEKLSPLEVLDASEGGFSFRVPHTREHAPLVAGQEVKVRAYLSQDTFLLLGVKIMSAIILADQGRKFMRYGCELDTSFASYPAYQQLMKFIEVYSSTYRMAKEKNSGSGVSGR